MAKHEILNFPRMDYGVSGLKVIKPPKLSFEVEVEFDDKIYKKIKDDAIIIEEMVNAARKVYDQVCGSIGSKLKAFDKLGQVMIDKGAPQTELEKQLDGVNNSISQDKDVGIKAAKQAVEAVWKRYQTKVAEYKKFKIKIGVNIFGAVAGLAVSIALMATSAFSGGAGAAVGIIGMIKSGVTIANEIRKYAVKVEEAQTILEKEIKLVEAAYKKHAALGKANEYTAVIVTQFLGVAQPNIKSIAAEMDVVENQLASIEIKCHEASATLNKILDRQEKLQAQFFQEVEKRLADQPGKKAKEDMKTIQMRLDGVILDSRAEVMGQIGTVKELYERWKKADQAAGLCRPKVEELSAMRGADVQVFENLLYFVDLPLAALDGNKMAEKATDLAKGLGSCGANMAYDKLKGAVLDKTLLA